MKSIYVAVVLLLLAAPLCAERVTFATGNIAGTSLTDRFFPPDQTLLGASCTVSAVRRVEGDLWCIRLTAGKQLNAAAIPIEFDYYVKIGSTIRLRRLQVSGGGLSDCTLKVVALDWNTATLEVQ